VAFIIKVTDSTRPQHPGATRAKHVVVCILSIHTSLTSQTDEQSRSDFACGRSPLVTEAVSFSFEKTALRDTQ